MRIILIAAVLTLGLAGCVGINQIGGVEIYSNPKAVAMRGCAAGIDVFTRGVSPQAIPGLILGSPALLGSTAEEAMAKCLEMLRALEDVGPK